MGRLLATIALIFSTAAVTGAEEEPAGVVTEGNVGDDQLALMLSRVVYSHLAGCHIVLASTSQDSPLLEDITRLLSQDAVSVVVVKFGSVTSQDRPRQKENSLQEVDLLQEGSLLQEELWGDPRYACRGLLLHLTDNNLAIRFFEWSRLLFRPRTRVAIVGEGLDMEGLLHHPSLHNTINVLYFAVNTSWANTRSTKLRRRDFKRAWSDSVQLFRRCLYCGGGEIDVQLYQRWNLTKSDSQEDDDLFLEDPKDFGGHLFKIVALRYFPVCGVRRDTEEHGSTLTLQDSLDFRMLVSFANRTNFTYEIREPVDREWGKELANGSWTGIIGNLQHNLSDFSLAISPNSARLRVMEISPICVRDDVVIFSPKASFLPQHLAIVKPFTGELWIALSVSILVWSVTLWLMQKAWSRISGGRGVNFGSAFFYSWGALIENWTPKVPINITGRTLVLVWLMACMIVTTAYRSSLVAHLTVQDRNPEVDTLLDLLSRDDWGWGVSFSGGALYSSFAENPDPAVQKIFKQMQFGKAEEHFRRVLEGQYSYISYKYGGVTKIAASYTNDQGYTPVHISRTEYQLVAGVSWGYRKGAPFADRINMMMQRLLDGGFMDRWLKDIIFKHSREAMNKAKHDEENDQEAIIEEDDGRVVLGLEHLQGSFFLLLLGYGLALLTLMGENLFH